MIERKIDNDIRLKQTPFTVPEGYFDEVRMQIVDALPAYPEKERVVPMSLWQRCKPYAYLAAMFLGIWCMMKVFHTVSSAPEISLDNPPEQVTVAMADNDTYDFYNEAFDNVSDIELEDEVSGLYNDMTSFESDFNKQN